MKKLVFGHQNPDTDSICSAMIVELGEKQKGIEIEAVALGGLNEETKYVLNYIGKKAPRIIQEVEKNQKVIMVDHNEFGQSVKNIEEAIIEEVYDHHRISNFQTKDQVLMNVQPLGCTATILYQKYSLEKVEITKDMAILIISAIVSDSLLFKSPTCTKLDEQVASELAKQFNIDIQEYGLEMLKAGTNLSSFSAEELLDVDTKEFQTKNGKYQIGQINTVDLNDIVSKENTNIINAIEKRITNNKLDLFMLVITDILNSNSIAYCIGENSKKVAKIFKQEIIDNKINLPGVVSRKKQIVPFL